MDKKGGISFITKIVLTILVVGVLIFIVFPSMSKSFASAFEPIKKLIGIDGEEDQKNSDDSGECAVKRIYWNKNRAKEGEKVSIVIEGNDYCDGKNVKIDIYKDISYWTDSKLWSIPSIIFDTNKATTQWTVPSGHDSWIFDGFYFVATLGTSTLSESGRLQIEE